MFKFMTSPVRTGRAAGTRVFVLAASVAAAVAAAIAGALLWAPMAVDLFWWKDSTVARSQQLNRMFWWTLPVSLFAAAVGLWMGSVAGADSRPWPGWRAAWRSIGIWMGVSLPFLISPLCGLVLMFLPPGIFAASLSGGATALLARRRRSS